MIGYRARLQAQGEFLLSRPSVPKRGENRVSRPWVGKALLWSGVAAALPLGALYGPLRAALALLLGVGIGAMLRGRRQFAQMEAFERDYPALLVSLASSVRAGLDPLVALISARTLFPPEGSVRRELDVFAQAIEAGAREEDALRRFGATVAHPDVVLLQNAFLIARREGASLGECLHRLARVTRQRQSFRRKIRGAVAMQRMSAIGIAGCAVVIGVFQSISNPQGIANAVADTRGVMALSFGGALVAGGLIWMIYLVRARI